MLYSVYPNFCSSGGWSMRLKYIAQLSFKRKLLVAAHVARLLCIRGIGAVQDFRWFCLMESWLEVVGVRFGDSLRVAEEEQRAA